MEVVEVIMMHVVNETNNKALEELKDYDNNLQMNRNPLMHSLGIALAVDKPLKAFPLRRHTSCTSSHSLCLFPRITSSLTESLFDSEIPPWTLS